MATDGAAASPIDGGPWDSQPGPVDAPALDGADGADGALVDAAPSLSLTSVTASSPLAGAPGVTLTLAGAGMASGATVTFAGKTFPTVGSGASVTVGPLDLPEVADNYVVVLKNPDGATASSYLVVNKIVPTITSVTASSLALGATGVTVTVTGSNFTSGVKVSFKGANCISPCAVSLANGALSFGPVTLPTSGQEVLVSVSNPSPTLGAATGTLVVPWPALSVTGYTLSKESVGASGVTLKIHGTNFSPGATLVLPVVFTPSGAVIPTRKDDGTELTLAGVTLPAAPGLFEIAVNNPSPTAGSPGLARVWIVGDGTSCGGLASVDGVTNCGVNGESCCTSLKVEGNAPGATRAGETFYRSYDGVVGSPYGTDFTDKSFPAQVSDFRLDKYEVTVGRFRKFVDAWVGGWRPAAGRGKHSYLNGGQGLVNTAGGYEAGWDSSWDSQLPTSKSGTGSWDTALSCDSVYQTWTSLAGSNEKRPINCVNWFEAYAFCIWDGGHLPSEAEWNYAASGGNEQRYYPWSSPASSTAISPSYASYYVDSTSGCMGDGVSGCSLSDLLMVGSKPMGNGRWGHSDLAGNVWEWSLDWHGLYSSSCADCVNASVGSIRVFRGGNFSSDASYLRASYRNHYGYPTYRNDGLGLRCSRTP